MIRLVLGGSKSGKSAFALERCLAGPGAPLLLATGRAADIALRDQILAHRLARPAHMAVVETGIDLAGALDHAAQTPEVGSVLVDSLDFWCFALLEQAGGTAQGSGYRQAVDDMLHRLAHLADTGAPEITLVSSEVGLGPLPATSQARTFARTLGGLHQDVARLCGEVCLVTAGLPLYLKRPEQS